MSKFSVRKPFTVFVAVIAAIIFGGISYFRMTPDLLPNMDFPYVVLVTTYPGATPEEVEEQVTKPLEQSMATLNNISGLSSTSSENFSMIMMEFEMDTNMDGVTVDILQKIQMHTGQWDESIGTPSIIRINPNMIPVMVAAVDAENMDRYELCRFAEDTLIPELEGTTGLASISTGGLVEQSLTLQLNDDKIDRTNKKIEDALRKSLDEARQELDDAQAELDENSKKVENGLAALSNAGSYLNGLENAGNADDITALATEIAAINSQLAAANSEKQALEAEKDLYVNQLSQMEAAVKPLEELLNQTRANRAKIAPILAYPDETELSTITDVDAAAMEYVTAQGCTTVADVRSLDNSLAATEIETTLSLQEAKSTLEATKAAAQARLPVIDQEIAEATARAEELQKQADAKSTEIAEIQAGLEKLPGQIAQGMGRLTAASTQLSAAQAALMSAQQTLDQAYETFENQLELALNAANLHNIISLEMLGTLVGAQNFDMPAGYVHENGKNIIVTVGDGIDGIEELENLVLFDMGVEDLEPVRLKDVADVIITDNADEIYATLNGNDGLILMFSKQSNYATAKVSDNIRENFAELSEKYPGVSFSPLMDQGDYIYLIRDSIMSSLLWGALFSVLILFLFLRDWRPTLITLLSIPVSLLFALTLMYFSGVSMNMMSMSGLAISVGMLVDNSVVVIENIYRLRALGESRIKAAVSGAGQVAGAIVASTLTTVCVFVPIAFVDGLTRELFTDMVLTLTFALVASLIVALTLVPAMGSRLLREYKEPKENFFTRLMVKYRRSVAWGVEHKAVMLTGSVVLLVLSGALVLMRGFTFMPEMEMEQMMVTMEMPAGSTFAETTDMADQVAARIAAVDGVGTVGGTIADSGSSTAGLGGEESGMSVTYYVLLDEETRRKPKAVAEEINTVCADMPCEVNADASSMMGSMMEMMSGSGVTVRVYSNNMDTLQSTAFAIGQTMEQVEGIAQVNTGSEEPTPEMHFVVDKEKALKEGLTVAQVYMEVAEALTGSAEILELTDNGLVYDVIIETKSTDDITPNYLRNLEFKVTDQRTGEEKTVKLRDVAQIQTAQSLTTINRIEQQRYLDVTGVVAEGYNVTLVTNAVEEAVSAMELPYGADIAFSGERENIMDAMEDLFLLLLVGIVLVYLVMVAQFQNLKSPFIVMFTIPLAFTGGFLALFVCGMELNILSMLGMIMLVGIIVNNGIVLVDYINQLRQGGMDRRAAIEDAACTRLRPILMTSITTILGLVVMALGQNEATSLIQPLAVTCIGGLLYATIMTLYIVPVMYDILAKKPPLQVDEADLELSKL